MRETRERQGVGSGEQGVGTARGSSPTAWYVGPAASVHLTLWLLGLLTLGMVAGSLLPQNVPRDTYLRLFGTLSGPVIARSTLTHVFTSWWFCTLFALLGVNLLACGVVRGRQLQKRRAPLPAYAPVLIHFGIVIVLVGAAWGHWPGHGYHGTVALEEGKVAPLEIGGERFGLRLRGAGIDRDGRGNRSNYWAEVEVVGKGESGSRSRIQSNHPWRYHHISAVVRSLSPRNYEVQVETGKQRVRVPVARRADGSVEIEQSYAVLADRTLVVVEGWHDESQGGAPAAYVVTGRLGGGRADITFRRSDGRGRKGGRGSAGCSVSRRPAAAAGTDPRPRRGCAHRVRGVRGAGLGGGVVVEPRAEGRAGVMLVRESMLIAGAMGLYLLATLGYVANVATRWGWAGAVAAGWPGLGLSCRRECWLSEGWARGECRW